MVLDFPATRTGEMFIVKSLSLWCFVTAAWAKTPSLSLHWLTVSFWWSTSSWILWRNFLDSVYPKVSLFSHHTLMIVRMTVHLQFVSNSLQNADGFPSFCFRFQCECWEAPRILIPDPLQATCFSFAENSKNSVQNTYVLKIRMH